MIYLMLFLGFVAHLIHKIIDAMKTGTTPLQWLADPKNYMYVALSLISCIALAFMVEFDKIPDFDMFGIIISGAMAAAFAAGWLNNSIIRAIVNKFTPKKK
jgi:hypothetical protein